MTTKHKPATPLPWDWPHLNGIHHSMHGLDAEYARHAANAYPRLVEALCGFLLHAYDEDSDERRAWENEGWALLRELGEE